MQCHCVPGLPSPSLSKAWPWGRGWVHTKQNVTVVLLLTFVHYSLMMNPQHMCKLYQRINLLGNHNYDMTIIIMAVITHTGGIIHVQKDQGRT